MRILIVLIIGLLSLPPLLQAKTYFVKLTPAGLQKRSELLNGSNSPSALHKQSVPVLKTILKAPQQPAVLRNWLQMEIRTDRDKAYLQSLQAQHLIEKAEPAGYFKINPFTNDSLIDRQWYLPRIGIPQAWDISSGDSSVIVGVIDTGVDYKHPDLQENIWHNLAELHGKPGVDDDGNGYVDDIYGWDFTDAPDFADGGDYLNPDPDPMDEFSGGHGTEVAGIIAAVRNNHIGISGIAPGVKIMVLRAGTASGYLEEDDVIRALFYAFNNGARIVNMSFGDVYVSTLFHDVLHYLWQQGMVLVSSAGNSGSNQVFYPAGFSETIAVGASDAQDRLAAFSSFGPVLDVLAPGSEILSTAPANGYATVNGTSFSAPVVSAEAALLLSHWPQLSNEQLRTILKGSASGHAPQNHQVGAGVVNAFNALRIKMSGVLQIDYPAPQSSVAGEKLPIVGSAYHPDLKSVQLSYGLGINPQQWTNLLTTDYHFFLNDTISVINLKTLPDTTLLIHLSMELLNGRVIDLVRTVRIDRTPPQILSVNVVPSYEGTQPCALLRIQSDDAVTLHGEFYAAQDPDKPLFVIDQPDVTQKHFIKINQAQFGQESLVYFTLKNVSGLKTVSSAINVAFPPPFRLNPWNAMGKVLPAGYLLPFTTDFDGNGHKEIVISQYTNQHSFGPVHIYEFSNGRFVSRFSTDQPFIPRDAGDVNGDGQTDLLLGFGQYCRIMTGEAGAFPMQVLWEDSSFWAAKIADSDQDGRSEIIGYRDSVYQILEWNGRDGFNRIAVLPNPSAGENRLGVPAVQVADLTGDGRLEIAYGDYDGDVIIYTCTGNNHYKLLTTLHTDQADATDLLRGSDQGLFALSHTAENQNLESEWVQRYWSLEQFRWKAGQQSFRRTWLNGFYPFFPKKNFESGLQWFQVNGQSLLFVSAYPYLYLFSADVREQWQPVWSVSDCRSNAVVLDDLDGDGTVECYFNTVKGIVGYSRQTVRRPPTPVNCRAQALDSIRVRVNWQGNDADAYLLYRGSTPTEMQVIGQVKAPPFPDSLPQMNHWYFYAVTAIDSSLPFAESVPSNVDSAQTTMPPRLLGARQENDRQIILAFDQPMKFNDENQPEVYLSSSQAKARSVGLLPGAKKALAVFDRDVSIENRDSVIAENFYNQFGVPLDQRYTTVKLQDIDLSHKPIVSHIKIKDRRHIVLQFSQPMNRQSLLDVTHYRLTPAGEVVKASIPDASSQNVALELSAQGQAGGFGQDTYLILTGLRNQQGVEIGGPLQLSLFRPVADLNQLVLYPQPVRPQNRQLIFAKLPQNTQIQIFTLNGKRIRSFNKVNDTGGIVWDLCDENGNRVGSGIYFYRVECNGQERIGKLVIVR